MNYFQKIATVGVVFLVLLIATQLHIEGVVAAQGSGGQTTTGQGIQEQDRDRDQVRDPSTHDGDEPIQDRDRDQTRLQDQSTTTGATTSAGDQIREQERERERLQERIHVPLESTTTPPAVNANQLRQMIQERERELAQEASTTARSIQNTVRNENQVRLAVHALLASKDLLGGIGPQVSQVAQQINTSVQTTVNAEARIGERGFWRRFFFGGDKENATILQREIERNREQIQALEKLLNQNTVSTNLRETLMEQVRAIQEEQTRLQNLAEQEQSRWGIFSWRF